MANILMISEVKNFIVTSLSEHIEKEKNKVYFVNSDLDEIEKIKEEMHAFFICIENALVKNTDLLVYLKDKANEDNIPIFLLGSEEQMELIDQIIPQQFIKMRYHRPINVKEVAVSLSEYLEKMIIIKRKKYWW